MAQSPPGAGSGSCGGYTNLRCCHCQGCGRQSGTGGWGRARAAVLAREEAVLVPPWGPVPLWVPVLSQVLVLVPLWVPVPRGHVQGV